VNLELDSVFETAATLISTWGLRVVGALVLLVVGRIVCGAIRRGTQRGLTRAGLDQSLVPFLSGLVYYLSLAVVVIAVLNLFGIQTASVIAVLGAAGLAIGLAMQGTLANFASGVMLLIFRPFRVGDYVEVASVAGSVQEIAIFSTTLHTPDNVRIVVPNSSIYGATIKNYSANDQRRNDLVIGVSYSDDLGRAIETVKKVLSSDERVLQDRAPVIAVGELADSSVNLVVRPWCSREDYWPLRFDLTRRLKEELEAAGCSIPFPQRDVHVSRSDQTAA